MREDPDPPRASNGLWYRVDAEERRGRLMQIQPLHNYVLIKPLEAREEVLTRDFIIPSFAQPETATGEILAIGPDVAPASGFKIGLKVLYPPYGVGENYEPKKGERYKFLLETDILAILNETA